MSMAGDVRCTALHFCIENNIPQERAIILLNSIVEDMDGDPDNHDFREWFASEYARINGGDVCPDCGKVSMSSALCTNCGTI